MNELELQELQCLCDRRRFGLSSPETPRIFSATVMATRRSRRLNTDRRGGKPNVTKHEKTVEQQSREEAKSFK